MRSNARSAFAILDGFLLFLALEAVFYATAYLGLHLSFDTPTVPYLACNLVWALLAALAAGYTVARVARHAPVAHGIVLALPLLALGAFNIHKGLGDRRTPYVLALNLLVPVLCIVGAWLFHGRARRRRMPGLKAGRDFAA
jgi:hypothetical protein